MTRHRRLRGERGATLVEASLVTPVLLLFVFGIFEFGFAFRDYLGTANTARDGAREVSVAGNTADADYRMLRALERGSSALPDGVLKKMVVFEATGPGDSVPSACLSGAQSGLCNVYTPADFALDATEFGCDPTPNPNPDPDRFWCPLDREVSVGTGLDFIGVYVEVEHEYITGLFGDSQTFTDTIILKVEPQEL